MMCRACGGAFFMAGVALLLAVMDIEEPVPPGGEPTGQKLVSKKVLVIGAGASGLVTLKEMLAHGHDAFAVESMSEVGGIFSPISPVLYDQLHLTTSNYFTAYSDFAPSDPDMRYWSAGEYGEYLVNYTEHFGLRPKIRFNTAVTKATLNRDEKWEVTLTASDGGLENVVVDSLAVSTGTNSVPKLPELPGFTGQVLHSIEVNDSSPFVGKRVLAIGTGESGSDVANLISDVAKETTVWARRPPMFAPRFLHTTQPEKTMMAGRGVRFGSFLETFSASRVVHGGSMFTNALIKWKFAWARKLKNLGHANHYEILWYKMMSEQNSDLWYQAELVGPVTKSYLIPELVAAGKVDLVVASQASFSGNTVTFGDIQYRNRTRTEPHEHSLNVDMIVCSTGWKFQFDWMEPAVNPNPRTWFRHAFPPEHADKLLMVGWARPFQGGLAGASELIARYGAMVWSGERKLPADYQTIALKEGKQEDEHFRVGQALKPLIDWPSFADSMARLIGCKPKPPPITNIQRWLQFWFMGKYSFWYRTSGPHAYPEAINSMLEKFPITVDDYKKSPMRFNLSILALLVQTPVSVVWNAINWLMGNTDTTELRAGWIVGIPMSNVLHGNTWSLHSTIFR